jgi:hypothetical protein
MITDSFTDVKFKGKLNSPIALVTYGAYLIVYWIGDNGSNTPIVRAITRDFETWNVATLVAAPSPVAYTQLGAFVTNVESQDCVILTYIQTDGGEPNSYKDNFPKN